MRFLLLMLLASATAGHHHRTKPKPIKQGHVLWPIIAAAKHAGKRIETCLAGVYATPDDVNSKTKTATGADPTLTPGIAHRTLKLNTPVQVCVHSNGVCLDASVIDRGPYGKLAADGTWFNGAKELGRPGKWRGCADISAPLAVLLGISTLSAVTLISER